MNLCGWMYAPFDSGRFGVDERDAQPNLNTAKTIP